MSTTRYYRFVSADVRAAARAYISECALLAEQAKALAEEFGGEPVFLRSVHGRSFGGLKFRPPKADDIWTKPDGNLGGIQRPRSSVRAKGLSADLAALRAKWKAALPTAKPSTDALYKSFGADWGSLLFAGIGYVLTDSAVYVATSLDLSARGQEITGGEYLAASEERAEKVAA